MRGMKIVLKEMSERSRETVEIFITKLINNKHIRTAGLVISECRCLSFMSSLSHSRAHKHFQLFGSTKLSAFLILLFAARLSKVSNLFMFAEKIPFFCKYDENGLVCCG